MEPRSRRPAVSPAKIRAASILTRSGQVDSMLLGIRELPLASLDAFQSDPRNPVAAESYLRRARELYEICSQQAGDIRTILDALLRWTRLHPERIDGAL
jgi:hypothetical protein